MAFVFGHILMRVLRPRKVRPVTWFVLSSLSLLSISSEVVSLLVMIGKGLSGKEISHLLGREQKVVQQYIEIAIRYHPDLPPDTD